MILIHSVTRRGDFQVHEINTHTSVIENLTVSDICLGGLVVLRRYSNGKSRIIRSYPGIAGSRPIGGAQIVARERKACGITEVEGAVIRVRGARGVTAAVKKRVVSRM